MSFSFPPGNGRSLDSNAAIVTRIGKKSARLVRMAATRLAIELLAMIRRPEQAVITKTLEGSAEHHCLFSLSRIVELFQSGESSVQI